MPENRVTEQYVEVLIQGDPNVRVTEQYLEALIRGDPNARVTEQYLEALIQTAGVEPGDAGDATQVIFF